MTVHGPAAQIHCRHELTSTHRLPASRWSGRRGRSPTTGFRLIPAFA